MGESHIAVVPLGDEAMAYDEKINNLSRSLPLTSNVRLTAINQRREKRLL